MLGGGGAEGEGVLVRGVPTSKRMASPRWSG